MGRFLCGGFHHQNFAEAELLDLLKGHGDFRHARFGHQHFGRLSRHRHQHGRTAIDQWHDHGQNITGQLVQGGA